MPSDATRWQRRNRRYLGVSFAVSHFIHLGVILALATLDRELFWKLTNVMTIVLAGTAYLFIAAMTATSFDRTAAWLGPRKWRLLHLIGGWYIWISFAVAVGKRVPLDSFYWPMAVLVLAIAVVRLIAMPMVVELGIALDVLVALIILGVFMLLVTGPVARNMQIAVRRAYEATPEPKLVVAVGDCGCTGGIFGESYASCGRVANVIPVDVAIPGCPPPPLEILRGILTAISTRKD